MKKLLFLTLCILCLPSLLNARYGTRTVETIDYGPKGNVKDVMYANEWDQQEADNEARVEGRKMRSSYR